VADTNRCCRRPCVAVKSCLLAGRTDPGRNLPRFPLDTLVRKPYSIRTDLRLLEDWRRKRLGESKQPTQPFRRRERQPRKPNPTTLDTFPTSVDKHSAVGMAHQQYRAILLQCNGRVCGGKTSSASEGQWVSHGDHMYSIGLEISGGITLDPDDPSAQHREQ